MRTATRATHTPCTLDEAQTQTPSTKTTAADYAGVDAIAHGRRPFRQGAYSAAAVRGRPTYPVASPKRSTMTAGRSLALLVTQAPERTA